MSASTTRQITGVLLKPDATPFANSTVTIYRDKREVVPQGDAAIVDEVLRTVTGPGGEVNMALVPGRYLGKIRLSDADRYFQFTVPYGAGPFVIADLIETSPISGAQYLTLLDLVTTARAWAEKPEDEEVVENGYSALHWAAKAKDARDDAVAAKTDAQAAAVAAAGSASSAAGSASTASTQASNAANSASAAANAKTAAENARDAAIDAKNDAQGYASDAQGYASAAAGSASSASTHATNAANSALAAAGSASAANDAKEYAEAARDEAVQAKEDAEAARDQANNIVGNLSGGLAGQFLVKNSNADYDYGWANVSGGGDMLASVYDPTGVGGDAFNMDNMVEGASHKILTAALKSKLDGIQDGAQVNAVTSVAGKTGAVTLSSSDISGLGNAATRNVGTTSGTVAAGDDSRITGALQRSGGTMTGALTLSGNPTSNLHAATKQYVDGQVIGGAEQTWQNVTTSRDGGIAYQNTTGRPIAVSIRSTAATERFLQWSPDGTAWVDVQRVPGTNAASECFLVVPTGSYYRFGSSSSGANINIWAELR